MTGVASPNAVRPAAKSWANELLWVLILCCGATGAYGVCAGQDTNWDQRNYHMYAVHAWFAGRAGMDLDVAPGQIQTWVNPLPHVVHYGLVRALPPIAAGAAMGALAGVNGLLLWILTRRLLRDQPPRLARSCALIVAVMGMTGSMYVSFIGTTFAEYLCGPLVIGALIVLLPIDRAGARWSSRALLVSGLLLGLATGLKLTNGVFALAMATTLVALMPFVTLRPLGMLAFAAGGVTGFAAFGGPWAVRMAQTFGNPVFPFFNAVFRSPWFDAVNFNDVRWPAKNLLHSAITYPLVWFAGLEHPTCELPFRDPRFALAAVILPLGIVASVLRVRRSSGGLAAPPRSLELWLLGSFFVISYGVWLRQFGVQRYTLPLELLAGVLMLLALDGLTGRIRTAGVILGAIAAFAVAWTRPPDWSRIPYGDSWYGLPLTTSPPAGRLYVMLGGQPISYAIPYLPRTDRFVRIAGNMPLEPQRHLGRRVAEIIRQHQGPIRTLSVVPIDDGNRARLRRFGLTVQSECETFASHLDTFLTCDLERVPQGQASP